MAMVLLAASSCVGNIGSGLPAPMEGVYVDSHSSVSPDEVWRLLEYVAPRCPVRGVNFEMDSGFPPFSRLVEELARARAILKRCGASAA